MHFTVVAAFTLSLSLPLVAQESFWVADRASSTLSEIDAGGNTLQTVTMSSTLRSAHVAPDGKVWVIRFIQPTFDIYDPATGVTTSFTFALGNPYEVTFDAAGHAWMSGGTGVEELDANGVSIATYPLLVSAPLGITVDNQGNKWIAHRASPASISRIDAVTGAISNHQIGVPTSMLPVRVIADYRGFATVPPTPSHIWVTGDSSGEIAEFDDQGNYINITAVTTSLSGLATDANGHLWVNDRGGNIFEIDATGAVVSSQSLAVTDSLGLTFDYAGRLWMTDRVTFSGTGLPCQIKRIDPATGVLEVPALVGIGTQAMLSTRYHHALVVDPLGDMDGDGNPNVLEVLDGTSAIDSSSGALHLGTSGISQLAAPTNTVQISLTTPSPTSVSGILFSFGRIPPVAIPGIDGSLQVGAVIAVIPATVGSFSIGLPIGNDPALDNLGLYAQAFMLAGLPNPTLSNRASLRVWL